MKIDDTDTHQLLVQLEEKLQELDSAREQVDKAVGSGNDLTLATSMLAKEVKKIADHVETKLHDVVDKGQKDRKSDLTKLRKLTAELKENVEKSVADVESQAIKSLQTQEKLNVATIDAMQSYIKEIQSYLDKLLEINIRQELDDIHSKISEVEKYQQKTYSSSIIVLLLVAVILVFSIIG